MIHPEKKITTPTQEIEILGMVVDSRTMELRLSRQKIKKLRQEAAKIRDQAATPMGWDVSCLLDKFNSVSQAIPPAPLFCRALQRDLRAELGGNKQQYDVPCPLSPAALEELNWWEEQLTRWSGKTLIMRQPNIQIESDASLEG